MEEVGETVGSKTDLNTKHNSLGSLPSSLVHFLHQRADQSRYDPMQVTVQGFTYIRSIVEESQVKYGSENQKINHGKGKKEKEKGPDRIRTGDLLFTRQAL